MWYILMTLFSLGGRRDWSDNDDTDILAHYRSTGDQEAFAVIYNRYAHIALGVCMKYMKDPIKAEDAAMEVFEKLLKDLRLQEVANFKAWLYTVCKNHCLMQLRSAKTQRNHQQEYEAFVAGIMENDEPVHLNGEQTDDTVIKALEAALENLPPEQQQCVRLFYLEKKSYKDIEDLTGFADTKVKSYIQNGKRNLKIHLTGKA